jgi:hypothetical protein
MNNNDTKSRLASAKTANEYICLVNESKEMFNTAMEMKDDLRRIFTPEVLIDIVESNKEKNNFGGLITLYTLLANHLQSTSTSGDKYDELVGIVNRGYGVDEYERKKQINKVQRDEFESGLKVGVSVGVLSVFAIGIVCNLLLPPQKR